ncbi:hypothetical protein KL921_002998 [Ogataea angusta]|nr:hypothetical protein KL921_002998 [Ogataea angusta]
MSESQKLEERLRLLENDLKLQKSKLVERLARRHVQTAPKTAVKRTANDVLKHDPDFAIKVRALKQAARQKKRLYTHIHANQVKFPYKNRIRINNLEFVSTNKGTKLALVSAKFLDSDKQLTSLDDLKTTLTYNGHRYIKTLEGDYVMQNPQYSDEKQFCMYYTRSGTCSNKNSCELAHYFECPDLQELGFCPRGSSCKLAHKTKVQPTNHKAIRNIDNDNVTQQDHPLLAAIQDSSSEDSDIEQTQTADLDMNHDYVQIA